MTRPRTPRFLALLALLAVASACGDRGGGGEGGDDDSSGGDDDSGPDDDDSSGDDDDSGPDDDDSGPDDDDAVDDDDSAAGPTVSIQQGIAFVLIPAGTFDMGCTVGQAGCSADAYPVHTVTLTHDFWMTQTEVTQAQYFAVMGLDPSLGPCGDDCPVQFLRWSHGPMFANVLSAAEGLTPCYLCSTSFEFGSCTPSVDPYLCDGYRLPTEAEWEYAARGGVDQGYPGGWLDDVAWYNANSGSVLHPVALKDPNAYGLYDMAGNVSEWVQDFYAADYYSVSPTTDPGGPATGNWRVSRGGSWDSSYAAVKVSSRLYQVPTSALRTRGFRVVRRLP